MEDCEVSLNGSIERAKVTPTQAMIVLGARKIDDEGDHDVVVVNVGFVDCAHTVGGQETVGNARHEVVHASALVTIQHCLVNGDARKRRRRRW